MKPLLILIIWVVITAMPRQLDSTPHMSGIIPKYRVLVPLQGDIASKAGAVSKCTSKRLVGVLESAISKTDANCSEYWLLEKIAWVESTGGRKLKNPISTASGSYQFLDSSWAYLCRGRKDSFLDQTKCVLKLIRKGETSHWAWLE